MSEDHQAKAKRATLSPNRTEETVAALPGPAVGSAPVAVLPEPAVGSAPVAVLPEPAVGSAPVAALPAPTPEQEAGADRLLGACHATLASIGAAQTAVASDVTAMAIEIGGLTRANLTAAGDGVAALFAAKSLGDAVAIQLGFTRRSVDAMVAGATRLNEMGLRLANDAVRPMLRPFTAG